MSESCLVCPSCGLLTQQLHQGYCHDCIEQREGAHLQHLHEFDRWQRLSPTEREREIRDAARRA